MNFEIFIDSLTYQEFQDLSLAVYRYQYELDRKDSLEYLDLAKETYLACGKDKVATIKGMRAIIGNNLKLSVVLRAVEHLEKETKLA
jgi:hypothetical protein